MTLRDDLLRPEAYAAIALAERVDLVETHISQVFLLDRDVFKVKKPVNLGFLDFRSLEQRHRAVLAELELNRRLAPDVYRGAVPVRVAGSGRSHLAGEGDTVDWAVHMARLPDETRADVLLARGALEPCMVAALARRLAAFHASARADSETRRFGAPAVIEANIRENFVQTDATIERYLGCEQADEVVDWQLKFLDRRRALFEERAAKGRVRDGHGDLRLEHVYFGADGVLRVIDCIEFNDRFRFADVCADVAFLSMDLASHGRVDLAEHFLAEYARESGDFDLYALVDFYESYRAFVRAKIAAMIADDEAAGERVRREAAASARRCFLLALSADRAQLLHPTVVAVGGIIASGKSTLAERIGAEMSAPVVDADRTRKGMLGVRATQPLDEQAWTGAYDPAFTERVYEEILRRAAVVLASGRPVVLDASFRSASMRAAAKALAEAHGVPFRFVECRASPEVCRARLERRARERGVSDGRAEVFDAFRARVEPVTELPASEHLVLDTACPLEETMARLLAALDTWPPGFGA
jgi:uncharacterized protein